MYAKARLRLRRGSGGSRQARSSLLIRRLLISGRAADPVIRERGVSAVVSLDARHVAAGAVAALLESMPADGFALMAPEAFLAIPARSFRFARAPGAGRDTSRTRAVRPRRSTALAAICSEWLTTFSGPLALLFAGT